MLDEELLSAARDAGTRADTAADAAHSAKDEYHDAIRRLQLAGATMREIAEALDVSHQRVQQIVNARGGGRRWRRRHAQPEHLACSFCGSPQPKVKRLISGPGIYICDRCVAGARNIGRAARPSADLIHAGARSRCGFCGKPRSQTKAIVEPAVQPAALPNSRKYERVAICNLCLDLCDEIAASEQVQGR